MVRFCILLLLPVLVSFAPQKKVPMRYANAAGDVLEITGWHTEDTWLVISFKRERPSGCAEEFSLSVEHGRGNRYGVYNEYASVTLRITERKVKFLRTEIFAEEDRACNDFGGVYHRIED